MGGESGVAKSKQGNEPQHKIRTPHSPADGQVSILGKLGSTGKEDVVEKDDDHADDRAVTPHTSRSVGP